MILILSLMYDGTAETQKRLVLVIVVRTNESEQGILMAMQAVVSANGLNSSFEQILDYRMLLFRINLNLWSFRVFIGRVVWLSVVLCSAHGQRC
jgi:hypothetical protein